MSNGGSFNWLAFLLGLAIGLWLSVVVLFLVDFDDDDCDCGPGGGTIIAYPEGDGAWVPGGNGEYFCTNNDEGRAIVIDHGRAIVADEGRAIVIDESGRVQVDEGRAVVADAGGFVPAPGPGSNQLNRDRTFEEFECDKNADGGATVASREGSITVVSMPDNSLVEHCGRLNGNAIVVNGAGNLVNIDSNGDAIDTGVLAGPFLAAVTEENLSGTAPTSTSNLDYCMVATPTSLPVLIRGP